MNNEVTVPAVAHSSLKFETPALQEWKPCGFYVWL